MSFPAKKKTSLPKIALLAAAAFVPTALFADDDEEPDTEAPTIEISNEDNFRAALADENNDGATLQIVGEGFTIQVDPPAETDDSGDGDDDGDENPGDEGGDQGAEGEPLEDEHFTITPVAKNFTISGEGSEKTTIKTTGNGDLLYLSDSEPVSVEKITFAGANSVTLGEDGVPEDLSDADGRVFIIDGGALTINGDTVFKDRFFSATATTSFEALGGAIVSVTTSDQLVLNSEDGKISFSGITAYGSTIVTETEVETEGDDGDIVKETITTETDLSAGGGAIYFTGKLSLSGENEISFKENTAQSAKANAMGGAIYVSNVDYSSSGVSYNAQSDLNYALYGFVAEAGTTISFSGNKAIGAVAAGGGAVFVYGGEFISQGGTISFEDNLSSSADDYSIGGALAVVASARATFEAGTTLTFSGNTAEGSGEVAQVSGGAIYSEALLEILSSDEDSTFSSATFSENTASASGNGSSAFGGAITSSSSAAVFSATGTFDFSNNKASATGEIAIIEDEDSDGETTDAEIYVPEAAGGAIAVLGGTFSLSSVDELKFSTNSAETSGDGTTASGGAIYQTGDATVSEFNFSGAVEFSGNFATSSGDESVARGGAIAITAGEASFSSADDAVSFSGNYVTTGANGEAQGGAIFVSDGEVTISAGSGAWTFSGNRVSAAKIDDETATGTTASGGAIYLDSGTLEISAETSIEFSENYATGATASGGAIFQTGGTQTFSATGGDGEIASFSGNYALATSSEAEDLSAQGGAIALKKGGTLSFEGTVSFEKNSAEATFEGETDEKGEQVVLAQGGAIYSSGNLTLCEVTFASNTAEASGGNNNYAEGGAIHISDGNFTAETLTFSGNSASVSGNGSATGGAIYSGGAGAITVPSLSAEENVATATDGDDNYAAGGAIYTGGALSISLDETEVSLKNNSAVSDGKAQGGAIYSGGLVTVLGTGTFSLEGNSAEAGTEDSEGAIAQGGAIYSYGSLEIEEGVDLTLSDNHATAKGTDAVVAGGFCYVEGGVTKIAGTATDDGNVSLTLISGNTAEVKGDGSAFGGAIYVAGGTHEFSNVEITGNSVSVTGDGTASGGAIYIDASGNSDTTLKLSGNLKISGNTATVGSESSASGISVGSGTAEEATSNVSIVISASAQTDSEGERSDVETVEILDPLTVDLAGDSAGFSLTKDDAGGDFIWAGENVINVESGNSSISLGAGNTTLQGGFSLTGTPISSFDVLSDAFLLIEEGATLGNFSSMTVDGTIDVYGAMNFSDANVSVADSGEMNFHNGATSEISGSTTISGTLNVFGEVTFSAITTPEEDDDDPSDVSFQISTLVLAEEDDETAPSLTFSTEGEGKLSVSIETISFADEGTITLTENMTLFVETVEVTGVEEGAECKFEGEGTIVFWDEATEDGRITFNSYTDPESGEVVAAGFSIAESISVTSGIIISENVTLSLGNHDEDMEYKYVRIDGGTLLAPETSEDDPLKLYDLYVTSKGGTLGAAGEHQYFELVPSPDTDEGEPDDGEPDDDGDGDDDTGDTGDTGSGDTGDGGDDTGDTGDTGSGDTGDTGDDGDGDGNEANSASVSGALEITATTTLKANVTLENVNTASLDGEGTLVGNVSGSGSIGIAKIEGDVTVALGRRITFTNTSESGTVVYGTIDCQGTLTISDSVSVSAETWTNSGTINVGNDVRLGGAIENSGTISVTGSLTFMEGSTFTLNSGALSVASGAFVDFGEISAVEDALSLTGGTIIIDTSSMKIGDEVTALIGLQEGQLDGVSIKNLSSVNLDNRIVWDEATGYYVYLGLNGRTIRSTLYADLTHENILRMYDFMETALMHKTAGSIRQPIFGENREKLSRYMRSYVERQRRFDPDAANKEPPPEVAEGKPGDYAKTLENVTKNAWVQTQYRHSNVSKDGENLSYKTNGFSALLGSSVRYTSTIELGGAFAIDDQTMKHTGDDAHKITTYAGDLLGFLRYYDDGLDFTLALSGSYAWHDSKRDGIKADFESWQIGVLWENGIAFVPEDWLEIRPFYGLETVYSRTEGFSEDSTHDANKQHFSLDSGDGLAFRARVGLGVAFLPLDKLQVTLRSAALFDVGDKTYEIDAYESSTNSDVVLKSHENEWFGVELGAYLNYRFTRDISAFGGGTVTLRSGEEDYRANVGVKVSF